MIKQFHFGSGDNILGNVYDGDKVKQKKKAKKCENCGSNCFTKGKCDHCGTEYAEESNQKYFNHISDTSFDDLFLNESPRKNKRRKGLIEGQVIQGNGVKVDSAKNCTFTGNGIKVDIAVDCVFTGNGNKVDSAKGCKFTGNGNKVDSHINCVFTGNGNYI